MISRLAIAGAAAVMLFAAPVLAKDNADAKFLKEATQINMAEVAMGKLAQDKGDSQGVRDFGQTLVTDHSASNEQIQTLASDMDVTLPTDLPADAQKEQKKLSGLSGAAFDREFVAHMAMGHKKAIDKFNKEAQSGSGKVASLAKETLPTLKKHLDMAQSLQKQMKTAAK